MKIINKLIELFKELFEESKCDTCINRKCISNDSICYYCHKYDKYQRNTEDYPDLINTIDKK